MKLTDLHDLNFCCTIKEEHPGKIGEMVEKANFFNLIIPVLRLCFYSVKQLFLGPKKYNVPKGIETVFVICSINQLRALEGLVKNIPNVLVISIFPVDCEHNLVVNLDGNYLTSLMNLPKLIFSIFSENGFRRKAMIYHIGDFINTPGVYNYAKKHLEAINPKTVILANDHTFFPRSYFRAAQKMGIKTIYTQHASVSAYFPELEFDYAFLDGEETLDKYTANGRDYYSTIFFSGSPRFDKMRLIVKYDIFDLGIAINILDNQEKIINFIDSLLIYKITVAVRPHPALANKIFWEEYCSSNNIGYSDPLKETPVNFISKCKRFVAGDSAFHLDVALCEKTSYFYNFQNGPITDWYEYIKNGLISVKTEEEIIDMLINNFFDECNNERVKYYVANFGEACWGKSEHLLVRTIAEINECANFNQWKPRKGKNKIFEIRA